MVYFGEYEVSLTVGGRIALPKRIREGFESKEFIITKGPNNCLLGYDKESWEGQVKEILNMPILDKDNPENLRKRRVLFSATVYLEVDEQGRAVLPKNLRAFAALSKKAVITGVGDHFEIWDKQNWEEYVTINY